MTVSLKHYTTATGTNNPDRQVSVDAWNHEHNLTGAAYRGIGFDGSGNATEVRRSVTPFDFGAKGDGTTDDSAAFLATIAYLKSTAISSGYGYGTKASGDLFVPAGVYYLGTSTLDITHTLRIYGEAMGMPGNPATVLRWADGTTGIRVQCYNTTGATAVSDGTTGSGDGTTIERLFLRGGYSNTESESHGIHLRGVATIRDVAIDHFSGDGIYGRTTIGGGAGSEGQCSMSKINNFTISNCRNGIYFDGADANVCTIMSGSLLSNRAWGVRDSSFLGNYYAGLHADSNGLSGGDGLTATSPVSMVSYNGNRYIATISAEGASTNPPSGTTADNAYFIYFSAGGPIAPFLPTWTSGIYVRSAGGYCSDDNNAQTQFSACYSESGQGPAQLVRPAIIIGGQQAAGVRGDGIFINNSTGDIGSALGGFRTAADSSGNYARLGKGYLEFNGGYSLEWSGPNLVWTISHSGVQANQAFELTGESTTRNIGKRRMNFMNGFGLGDKKVLSGTAAPTSGTYVQGDMMYNSAPAASGNMGWVCVTGGTPGTWKTFGTIAA